MQSTHTDMSETAARQERVESSPLTYLGPLHGPSRRPSLFSGSISRREHDPRAVNRALDALPHYYVPSNKAAPERCIDGRPRSKATDRLEVRHYGAQSPGGTPGITLAYRIMKVHELKNKTFCTDLEKTISLCKAKNIFFGAHIDSHAKHTETGCTGCGAIDKIPDIFSKMLAPEFKVAVAPYLEAILGDTYAEHRAHEMLTRIALLQKSGGEYFEHETGGVYNYRTKTIEGIRNGAEKVAAIEELVGDHREVALVVNKVKGWTFDRDRFAQDHGVQAFNYDYWVSEKFASQLFDTEEERKEFLTVRAMLAVATAMVLTDGSIELVVRS